VILVEGNIDLVSLHQAGITNVVAPLGTALTSGHIRALARYTRNMTLIFDGDSAGIKAAIRSLEIFIEAGISPRVVALPDGEDPDSMVKKEGAEAFQKRISAARSLFEFFVDKTVEETGGDATGKIAAVGRIVPILKAVADEAERGIYRRYLSQRLDIDENSIEKAISRAYKGAPLGAVVGIGGPRDSKGIVILSAERLIIEVMLSSPRLIGEVFAKILPSDFHDEWCKTIANLIYEDFKVNGAVRIAQLIEGLDDAELKLQMTQASFGADRINDKEAEELLKDCVQKLKIRPSEERFEQISSDIKTAEMEGNEEKILSLLNEKKELAQQMKKSPLP
jgi:DNA primase